jgi:hypothetical protein
MQADGIRHSALTGKQIKSGGPECQKCNYGWKDAFLTADLKYHQFYEPKTNFSRYWHFESERYTKIILLIIFGKNP